MTDYKQEQKDEIEAIESIYSEEIDILGDSPHRFTIPIKTAEYDDEDSDDDDSSDDEEATEKMEVEEEAQEETKEDFVPLTGLQQEVQSTLTNLQQGGQGGYGGQAQA